MNIASWKESAKKIVIAVAIAAPGIYAAYERLGFWEAYSAAVSVIALALGYDIRTLGKWAGERMENG